MQIPQVDELVRTTEQAVSSSQRVWISGTVGSGRHTIARALGEQIPDAHVIEFLDLAGGDGVAGSVLQLAASLSDQVDLQAVTEELREPESAGKTLSSAIDKANAVLIALVPASWTALERLGSGEDHIQRRARALLRGLGSGRRVVWIVDKMVAPEDLGVWVDVRLELPWHRVPFPRHTEQWAAYGAVAEQVAKLAGDLTASPLVWRLSVGAAALGADPSSIARAVQMPTAQGLNRLCQLLMDRLEPLQDSVEKALLPRIPLARRDLIDLTQIPEEHIPLLTDCIGYGEPVRVPESLRVLLRNASAPDPHPLEDGHLWLANHYEKLDGAAAPLGIDSAEKMGAWVEKVHHLGRAGAKGVERWEKLELPSPDFYWDRGRCLSVEFKDYRGAASVYQSCVERFPKDDYAHQYLAWNLERAKQNPRAVLHHYRESVEHNPTNPWWNSRLVTALIRQQRYIEAHVAWTEAIERIDPDGTVSASSPWLAFHFHWWVAKAWTAASNWREARRVLGSVPAWIRKEEGRFDDLEREIDRKVEQERQSFESWLQAKQSASWDHARRFWKQVVTREPLIPTPAAIDLEEGAAQLVWSLPDILLEVELDDNDTIQWDARDRRAGTIEATEHPVQDSDEPLWSWLKELAHV